MKKSDFNFSYLISYLYNAIKSEDIDEAYDTFLLILDLVFLGKDVPRFFAELLDKNTLTMLNDIDLVKYKAKETICKEGEHSESMFIIVSGTVRVSQKKVKSRGTILPLPPVLLNNLINNLLMGGTRTLSTLSTGDFFGESALFSSKPMPVTATALTDVETLVITNKTLQKAMSIKPDLRSLLKEFYVSRLDSMFESLQKEQSMLQSCVCENLIGAAMPGESGFSSNALLLGTDATMNETLQGQTAFSLKPKSRIETGLDKVKTLYAENRKPEAALLYLTLSRLFLSELTDITIDMFTLKVLNNPKLNNVKLLSDVLGKIRTMMPEISRQPEPVDETDYRTNFLLLFNDLLKRKLDKVSLQQYNKGQAIINHADMSDSIYVIKAGSVKIVSPETLPYKVESRDIILGEGEILGEIAFFTRQPNTATVIAAEETSLYELNRPLVTEIVKEYPEVLKFFEKVYQDKIAELIKEAEAIKAYYKNDLTL
ncbi:MAG: cyclic nucleotide-binding domain-containing protein [Nitrospirae bacterium]|uniref:cyclic nucleotide-binding domain-containing protein n=1 Tax=Candidatus Magnetobacterium casense TaxID=1455061 RepID=UPI00138E30D8|nr:cyclic nucleotide-binding domain-containing protein [Candidatus Magnetobacterium casensis]MBF0337011.1 cyclic nucleotide-binding domain-containing protein [Nitrospirota bacterium]